MRVRLANSSREFDCARGQNVLEAALAAGLNLPHSCRGGNCGACRALKLDGELHYPNGRPLGISPDEAAQGYVLLCQARPRSDLLLELQTVQRADQAEVRRLPCRIDALELVTHDVMRVVLKLPAAEPLAFRAGQYVDVLLPQARRRSFSIASPPLHGQARLLELFVRRVPGGEFSERLFGSGLLGKVFGGLKAGALLEIEGPLGQFYLRTEHPQRPLLLIGGGTGLAPLLSIARDFIAQGYRREIRLYWGVRTARDLFSLEFLDHLVEYSQGAFSYQLVLSEPGAAWRGRRGWVHEAALGDLGTDLNAREFEVYAAGPPAMIVALRGAAQARALPPERLFFDVFDYAIDGPRDSSSASSTP